MPPLEDYAPDAATRERLAEALRAAPPRGAEGLERVLERDADGPDLLRQLAEGGALPRALALVGLGGAPAEALMGEPRDLLGLLDPPPDPARLELTGADADALRAVRRRTTLATAARELAGELEATDAGGVLSGVARRLLAEVLRLARSQATRRHGDAAQQVRLAVLAFGKLGGAELNYSSDVDLVLARADDAPPDVAVAVGRAFVAILQESTARGRLYRVDLRLRPFGSSGELVPRSEGIARYYAEHGRAWERMALLKASVVAGDAGLGGELLARLEPWLWRRGLEARSIQEIFALRERMSASADEAERDVKVGPGGIRDVEFAVQILQLLHGGDDPRLRTPNTLEAIARLRAARILREEEALELAACYGFLRRVEHLLQLVFDREETRLPRGEELRPLAASARLTPDSLEEGFAEVRQRARGVLDRLLRAAFAGGRPGERALDLQDLLLAGDAPTARAAEVLAPTFGEPEVAWRHLQDLARERHALLAPSGRARTLLAGLAPRLLDALAATADPDRTLKNLQRATSSLGAKATVYELMAHDPDALELLVRLGAGSDVLAELLARHPGVFDEVVDRLLTRAPPRIAEVEVEVAAALASADPEGGLREVRALYLLLTGALDLGGRANVQNTARSLADVAEGFLRAFLARAEAEVAERHGGAPPEGGLVTLALGKLAGRELSYSSDVDLVLVCDGERPAPDGALPSAFWSEVAQRVVTFGAGQASAEGALLPIDLRLRPGGRKAPLVVTRAAALAYYRGDAPGETARDFERLALQKHRAVAGPSALTALVEAELQAVLYERPYGSELWDEVEEMRRRQRLAAPTGDPKRGAGSLADVELLASALALRHGGRRPGLREPHTVRLLRALEAAGLLTAAEHTDLRTAYGFLRRLELRLRVRSWQTRPLVPPEGAERRDLALALDYVDVGAAPAEAHFTRELAFHRRRIEETCAAVIARDRAAG